MAWTEDRWSITVTGDNGTSTQQHSARHGTGLRWRVRYETPDGRERSRSFTRKPDADRFRAGIEADLLRGTYMDPDAGKITLAKYGRQWLAAQTFDDVSREATAFRLSHILAGLGDKRLDQLASTPTGIQAWMNGLKLAPSTRRQCLTTLSAICSAAVDDGRMIRNPCRTRSVKLPRPDRRKIVPLEMPQLAAIREGMPDRYAAMIEAGSSCGLRQGEIFGLSPDDIDFLPRVVHVLRQVKIVAGRLTFARPKGDKTRDVPLPAAASLAFAAQIAAFPPARVTLPWHEPGTKRHGKPVTVRLMFFSPQARNALRRHHFNWDIWKPAIRSAGLPDVRVNGMHMLRHSYASMLLHNGTDIRRVAECLGHDDPGFTLRVYTHLMAGGDDQVRQAIDSAFAGGVRDIDKHEETS
jgi:integrase